MTENAAVHREHPYYPLFLDLTGRKVVIIGGGAVSARKAESLLRHGAQVVVVAPDVVDEILSLGGDGQLTVRRKTYESDDLEGAFLVIASTNAASVNQQIATDARARGILLNIVDDTPLCDFIVPAVVERGSIRVAVSTGGRSPAFARVVKRRLEEAIGPEYAELNDILGSLRDAAKTSPTLPADADRKRFFDELITLGVLELLREGRRVEAYERIAAHCAAHGVPPSALIVDQLASAR